MVKQSYYFSHDSNARNDPKICELRAEFGWEGYGIFWGLIEIMSEQENYSIDPEKIKYIAFSMNLKVAKLQRYVNFMVSNGLLVSSDDCLTSKSLLERMRQKEEKSNKMRENANKKHNKNNSGSGANGEQTDSNGSANDKQTDSNGSALNKGKETKEIKERKENWFLTFWESYPNKKAKPIAKASFMKLNLDDDLFNSIMNGLDNHKKSITWKKDDGEFIPHPSTWINQERWNDEVKIQNTTQPTTIPV